MSEIKYLNVRFTDDSVYSNTESETENETEEEQTKKEEQPIMARAVPQKTPTPEPSPVPSIHNSQVTLNFTTDGEQSNYKISYSHAKF